MVETKVRGLGTKAKIKKAREKEKKVVKILFLTFALIVVLVTSYFAYTYLQPASQEPFRLKAALVDHLSLTYPNQTFVDAATTILQQAGYTVDYYSGSKTTVEFWRELATHGYSVMILRVHSSATAGEEKEVPLCFFTAQSYSQSDYVSEQLNGEIGKCSYLPFEPPYYFAITPKFVESSMNGKFNNTFVIMMGCEGLRNTAMAEAFIAKGAKAYLGWNGSITVGDTDRATQYLLQHLVAQNETVHQATTKVMEDVGVNPEDNSILQYFPNDAGKYVVLHG
jgi:hypothetical protein